AGWDRTTDIENLGYVYDGRHESAQAIGEFRFLGVENLTAVLVASLDKLEEFDYNGNIVLSETFAYKFNNLALGINAAQFLYNRKFGFGAPDPHEPGLLFNLWGSYTIDRFVPRLDLVYFMGGKSLEGTAYHRRAFVNTPSPVNVDDDRSVISGRVSVKFNLDSKTFIEIGNLTNIDYSKNFAFASEERGRYDTNKRISNVFYIDYKWSF
ncbi:MAG: hypothetical protein LBH07_08730, partial [Treponema sp.]|nr:hypothetical protein [Treponema sp.]